MQRPGWTAELIDMTALAEKLARENMQVVMADIEEESLEVAVEDLREH